MCIEDIILVLYLSYELASSCYSDYYCVNPKQWLIGEEVLALPDQGQTKSMFGSAYQLHGMGSLQFELREHLFIRPSQSVMICMWFTNLSISNCNQLL